MYRIKTDIREYRCKNREKVERLIRNWVIRPTDLLFDQDRQGWAPIGEEQGFRELFVSLDEIHANQAATVVTERVAQRAADDREAAEIVGKPRGPNRVSHPTPGTGIIKKATRKTSSSGTLLRDLSSGPHTPLPIPEAPEGVEGLIRDSGEITKMTDKTLDLLSLESENQKQAAASVAPEDEPTAITMRPDFEDSEATGDGTEDLVVTDLPVERSERKQVTRADLPEDVFETAEISAQDLKEKESVLDELGALEGGAESSSPEDLVGLDDVSRPRWNIVLDEKNETSRTKDTDAPDGDQLEKEEAQEEDLRETAVFESLSRDEICDAEVESSDLALRETADLDLETLQELSQASSEPSEESSKELLASEPKEPAAQEELRNEESPKEALDPELRDTADLTEEAQEASLQDEGEELEIDEDALDEAIDELEEVATQIQELDDFDDFEELPVVETLPVQNLDMVSAGYTIKLPVDIGPSNEAQELGIKATNLPESVRDKLFSQPYPKRSGTLIKKTYYLGKEEGPKISPKTLYSLLVALVAVAFIISGLFLMAR